MSEIIELLSEILKTIKRIETRVSKIEKDTSADTDDLGSESVHIEAFAQDIKNHHPVEK